MAKININFNDKEYSIDSASLSAATAELKQHLSTVMNGTGATIEFDGTSYGVDSTKLSTATNAFVAHLGTIAGSGSKVMIGGVEYGIDSAKVASALGELDTILGGLNSGNSGVESRDPIVWDGNTDEVEKLDFPIGEAYKVSNELIPANEFIGAEFTDSSGQTKLITEFSDYSSQTGGMLPENIMFIDQFGLITVVYADYELVVDGYGVFRMKKGLYFNPIIRSVTFPQTVKTLDE